MMKLIYDFLDGQLAEEATAVCASFMERARLVPHCMELLNRTVDEKAQGGEAYDESRGELVHSSLKMLKSCILEQQDLLDSVYSNPNFESMVVSGLVRNRAQRVRETMGAGLKDICTAFDQLEEKVAKPPRRVLLPLLLRLLPQIDTQNPYCGDYFLLVQHLLESAPVEEEAQLNPKQLTLVPPRARPRAFVPPCRRAPAQLSTQACLC